MDARHIASRVVAWGGAALFVASLLYFVFSYSITFGEIVEGSVDAGAIGINVGLFTIFALHHSVFARDRVRDAVRAVVSNQLERSVYVWAASLMLIAVCYFWQKVPGVLWQVPRPWNWALIVVQAWAAWLTVRSAAVIDALDLAGLRQVSNPNTQIANPKTQPMEFKTDGPYGWVRHPIYAGWILLVFSAGTMTMTRFVFAAISTIYLLMAIPLEEHTLRANAGRAYEDYKQRVPWKLIPRVY